MDSYQLGALPWREDESAVEFTGRLERDPEFYERDGESRCSLLIACTRTRLAAGQPVKRIVHIQVKASDALAEEACRHLRRGAHVRVTGELDSYTASSADGGKRTALQVAAASLEPQEAAQSAAETA